GGRCEMRQTPHADPLHRAAADHPGRPQPRLRRAARLRAVLRRRGQCRLRPGSNQVLYRLDYPPQRPQLLTRPQGGNSYFGQRCRAILREGRAGIGAQKCGKLSGAGQSLHGQCPTQLAIRTPTHLLDAHGSNSGAENDSVECRAFRRFGRGTCPETPRRFGVQERPETPHRFRDDLQSLQLRANRPSSAFDSESSAYPLEFSDMCIAMTTERANISPNEAVSPMIAALTSCVLSGAGIDLTTNQSILAPRKDKNCSSKDHNLIVISSLSLFLSEENWIYSSGLLRSSVET